MISEQSVKKLQLEEWPEAMPHAYTHKQTNVNAALLH